MSTLSELARQVLESGQADLHVKEALTKIDTHEPSLKSLLLSDREFVQVQVDELGQKLKQGQSKQRRRSVGSGTECSTQTDDVTAGSSE